MAIPASAIHTTWRRDTIACMSIPPTSACAVIAAMFCSLPQSTLHAQGAPILRSPSAFALATSITTGPALESSGDAASTQPAGIRSDPRARGLRAQLFWGTFLVVVLVASAIAIIRFSRRFRTYLLRDRREPTHYQDVWAMHKLPTELVDEEPDLDNEPPPFDSPDDGPPDAPR
jgi:hypothetical protein